MLKNYSDLKSMMVELEKANLDPDTKIRFGDSDSNEYIVSRATIVPLVDVLNYDSEEDENGEEFNKEEKCIFFEVEYVAIISLKI